MPEPIVMMSDILANTAWSIVLTPYQCQVITPTNPDFLWMDPSTNPDFLWMEPSINPDFMWMEPSINPDFLWMEPSLTRWQESKLDDIVQMVFQMHFCDWKLVNFIQQLIKIHSYGVIGKKSVLDELMAWRLTGEKP